jgi:hypothetical protein
MGLNSPCDKNASAALWKREPISDDYLPSMRKAVLSISGNVYKQQEMEIDKTSFIYDKLGPDKLCFVNFYKMLNFHNIVRNGKRKWKKYDMNWLQNIFFLNS